MLMFVVGAARALLEGCTQLQDAKCISKPHSPSLERGLRRCSLNGGGFMCSGLYALTRFASTCLLASCNMGMHGCTDNK